MRQPLREILRDVLSDAAARGATQEELDDLEYTVISEWAAYDPEEDAAHEHYLRAQM